MTKEQSMNVAIIVAIVALVSTIVGATIGALTNYTLAVRREQSDKQRDDHNHAIEVKRAARLIDHELLRAQAGASICIEKKRWSPVDEPQLSTEARQSHLGTIAADLSDQAWLSTVIGLQAAESIRWNLRTANDRGAETVSDTLAETLVPMLEDIKRGRSALAPFVRDSLPAAGK